MKRKNGKKKSKINEKYRGANAKDNVWMRLGAAASAPPIPDRRDEEGISQHFLRCRPLGIACAALVGVDDPEDVFTEAYLSILNGPRNDARAWAYLPYRLRSRARTAYRRKMTRQRHLNPVPLDEEHAESIACQHGDFELMWMKEDIGDLLAGLSSDERRLIQLHHLLGWSITDLVSASAQETTISRLKCWLFRLRAKLRNRGRDRGLL
jgi:RNA polymerase sigma factor (sigma-70 family)